MSEEYQPMLTIHNQPLLAIQRGVQSPMIPLAKINDIRQQCMNAFAKLFESFQSASDEHRHHPSGQRSVLYLTGESPTSTFMVSPKTGNDWGYTNVLWESEKELSLENERLKTQLMAEKRTVLQERRRYSDLSEQNEKLWQYVSEFTAIPQHADMSCRASDLQG